MTKVTHRKVLEMLKELRKYWKGDTSLDYLIKMYNESLKDEN